MFDLTKLAKKAPQTCLLCSRPRAFIGVFQPDGKKHRLVYALCASCAAQVPLLIEIIEARIEQEISRSGHQAN